MTTEPAALPVDATIPIVQVRDLVKSYVTGEDTLYALDGVSLDIQRGEFVAIMGASGSGKSTLMNILGCLDVPTSGEYLLDGIDVGSLTDDELSEIRNEKIGFVFQSYNLLPHLAAMDEVMVPLVYGHLHERRERAMAALERVGLADRADHSPTELSGGQQQRVAIVRALVTNPTLLFADEPTGNLDSHTSDEIVGLLQELNEQGGLTILMVTHEADVAAGAQRLIRLGDGKIIEDGPVEHRRHLSARASTPTP